MESLGAIMNIIYWTDRRILCAHESGYVSVYAINSSQSKLDISLLSTMKCADQPLLHLNIMPENALAVGSVSKSFTLLRENTSTFSQSKITLPFGGLCVSKVCAEVLIVGSWDGLIYFIDFKQTPPLLLAQSKWHFPHPVIFIDTFYDQKRLIFSDSSAELALIASKCGSVSIVRPLPSV